MNNTAKKFNSILPTELIIRIDRDLLSHSELAERFIFPKQHNFIHLQERVQMFVFKIAQVPRIPHGGMGTTDSIV